MLGAKLAVAAALLIAAEAPQFPPARSLVPYVETGDVGCHWTVHDPKEKWIRGGIGQGDDDPVFQLVDRAFDGWSDSGRHAIEISAGDPARRVPVEAWADGAASETPGSVGFYMNAGLRELIGGATSVQVWKDGKPVLNAVLAGTPTAAQLDACVQPPGALENSDQE